MSGPGCAVMCNLIKTHTHTTPCSCSQMQQLANLIYVGLSLPWLCYRSPDSFYWYYLHNGRFEFMTLQQYLYFEISTIHDAHVCEGGRVSLPSINDSRCQSLFGPRKGETLSRLAPENESEGGAKEYAPYMTPEFRDFAFFILGLAILGENSLSDV